MPNHDGYTKVTVNLESSQVLYCKEHAINLSALVRGLLRGYIMDKEE